MYPPPHALLDGFLEEWNAFGVPAGQGVGEAEHRGCGREHHRQTRGAAVIDGARQHVHRPREIASTATDVAPTLHAAKIVL